MNQENYISIKGLYAGANSADQGRHGEGGKLPLGLIGGLIAGVLVALMLASLAIAIYLHRRCAPHLKATVLG